MHTSVSVRCQLLPARNAGAATDLQQSATIFPREQQPLENLQDASSKVFSDVRGQLRSFYSSDPMKDFCFTRFIAKFNKSILL
jgi:hypothetical protein